MKKIITFILFSLSFAQYFDVTINPTGESHLIILLDSVTNLEVGDEIGVFDAAGVVEDCSPADDCANPQYGEVLVGAGTWADAQLAISAIMSIDLSDFNGPILNGAIDDHPIIIKVFDVSEQTVFSTNLTISTGGEFGDLFTVINDLELTQILPDCLDGTDVCLTLDGNNLYYESTAEIAGFQFDHDGCVTAASGGDAEANGFTFSVSGTVVLAFSFSGAVIPAGSGTLVVLEGTPTEECLSEFVFSDSVGDPLAWEFSCDGDFDCAGECGGDAVVDECGDCGGDGPEENFDCDGNCIVDIDCNGDCGGTAVVDDCDVCDGGNADMDCNDECFGGAVVDECGECGGDGIDEGACDCEGNVDDACGECNGNNDCFDADNTVSISSVTDDGAGNLTMFLAYDFNDDVTGFQFDLLSYDGAGENILSMTGVDDGVIDAFGFSVSISPTTVLGFSFSGAVIPPGSGDFLTLTATYDTANNGLIVNITAVEDCDSDGDPGCDSDDTRFVLSDTTLPENGGPNPLDSAFIPGCWIVGESGVVDCYGGFGCTDASACNYDPYASVDDGSCAYELDCAGECGGDAVVDDCGVCNGENLDMDCAGVCDGDSVEDCAGECGGDGVLDECGICDGDNSTCSGCTDPEADNYDSDALLDDDSCEYSGCTDPYADNYDPQATTDDDSCEYTVVPVWGTIFLEDQSDHSGVNIEFMPISGSAQIDTVQTDDTGSYFAGLSPGMYVVNVFKDGYIPITMPGEFAFFVNTQLETYTLVEGSVQEISGTLDGNQHWTAAYQYRITDHLTLSDGDTLVIDPGVEIQFMGDYNLILDGLLQANGTQQDSILFTSGLPSKTPGDWNQIIFNHSDSYLSHTIVEYAGTALMLYADSVMIDASTIRYNSAHGIHLSHSDGSIISGCRIHHNNDVGINTEYYDVVISNNQIFENNNGIRMYHFYNVQIEGNHIYNNQDHEIYAASWTGGTESLIIDQNVIEDEIYNGYGLYAHVNNYTNYLDSFQLTNNQINIKFYSGVYIADWGDASVYIAGNTISSGNMGLYVEGCNSGVIERNDIKPFDGDLGYGIILNGVENIDVRNNNIWGADNASLTVQYSPGASIYNNLMWDDNYGMQIYGETPYVGYNCFWESNFDITDDFPFQFGEIITTNVNGAPSDTWYNIFQDPELTDIDGGDFTPIEGSVVIDAGATDSFDPDGSIADIGLVYYDQGTAEPVITSISASQTYGTYPLFVQFSAEIEGPANTYSWDFGNGQSASGVHPVTSYSEAGTYSVSLSVEGPGGSDTYMATDLITVVEPTLPPEPGFMADVTLGLVPLEVQFSNLTLNEADSYVWDFGDGESSTQFAPSHTYQMPGVYSVSLSASGPYGDGSVTMDDYINALEPEAIIAGFSMSEDLGVAPFTVDFENTTIGTVDDYLWDFGDGESSGEPNPSHTYNDYGTFTITLTATGPVNEDSASQSVDVFLPSPIITDISDVPDDQGGRVYLTFIRSGHDTDSLNRFESYQVERLDDIGWVGVTNYNAYGTDIYNIEVPTLVDSTSQSNAVSSFRVIASMDEGLWESNTHDGYSVDNLAPSAPEDLFASSQGDEMYLGWSYIMDDDFAHHQINQILGEPYTTITNDINIDVAESYNEFFVNSVDVHGNLSDGSEYASAHNLNQGANLVSFSILPDDNSIFNVLDGVDVDAVIGEGLASAYNANLGWVGSLITIQSNQGYWLKSSDGEILNIIGTRYETDSYDLHYGANLVAYNCQYPASIEDIIASDVVSTIIGEGVAATYNTALGWVGSLEYLNPGSGYWMFTDDAFVEISYDCPSQGADDLSSRIVVPPIGGYAQSTQQAFYFFGDVEGIETGDVIRSYHDNHLIGARAWLGAYSDVPAMGLDFQDETQGYAQEGSPIRFTLQKQDDDEVNLDGNFPLWSSNGIFIIESANIVPELPDDYSLNRVYPNPFNPSTTIEYSLPEISWVSISIYDIKGVEIARLVDRSMQPGYHSVTWSAADYASGVYIIRIDANGFSDTQKIMLLK